MSTPSHVAGELAPPAHRERNSMIMGLAGGYLLLELALWSGPVGQAVFGIGMLVWAAAWVIYSRESAQQLGVDRRAWRRGTWILSCALGLSAGMLSAAYLGGTLHTLFGMPKPFPHGLVYAFWAVEQEFMLQSFYFVTLCKLLPERWAILASAFLFSFAHLPNLALTVLTLFGGYIFTSLFARYRSVYIIGVAHAVLGLSLAMVVPDTVMHHMKVGLGYYHQTPKLAISTTH
ncbi:MAG TPA: CPBP family intramembrane glutamic endopeptidase [Candidatus Acidoferrales bacterium]|nr:CPBP family intramembrane glutamic endopeptidase [Candidatus Acidoferrales bacterium]